MLGSLVIYVVLYGLACVTAFSKRSYSYDQQIFDHEESVSSQWMWHCQNDGCVRVRFDNVSDKFESRFTTIAECRLVCLPFSTVWPRPTGEFKISRELQVVDLSKFSFNLLEVKGGTDAKEYLHEFTESTFMRDLKRLCPKCGDLNDNYRKGCYMLTSNSLPSYVDISFRTETLHDMILNWNTDEKYALVINSTLSGVHIHIDAATVFGARHALQTLSQLFACRKIGLREALVIMSDAKIIDRPVYSHRGLLLDTSRTFLPVDDILRTLDGMSSAKLNVFHWHISDSHSFPFYSKSIPKLSRYGAYSPKEVYTPNDIKMIREHAFLHGIRIIVEIDAPAHAGYGWQWGEKDGKGELVVCLGKEPWHEFCIQPPCGQLNPVNPNVYTLLGDLYKDIQDEFLEDMFHMGGDEVCFPCWLSEPSITNWMKEHGMNLTDSGLLQLWSYFQEKALHAWDRAAQNNNTPIILWSSQLTDPETINKFLSPHRYIIEVWTEKSDPSALDLLSKGYRLIIATKDAWYLDHGFWGSTTYHKWTDVYENKIFEAKLGVFGGEACMWSEYVGDTNLDSRLWPRVACVGERLWSNPTSSAQEALPRLLAHSDRLSLYNIKPDMIVPEWCRQNDGKC